jgi:hypothetical protein
MVAEGTAPGIAILSAIHGNVESQNPINSWLTKVTRSLLDGRSTETSTSQQRGIPLDH